jgi:cell wall-associated NlpC family hydrolase
MDATHVSYVSAYTSRKEIRRRQRRLSRRRLLGRFGAVLVCLLALALAAPIKDVASEAPKQVELTKAASVTSPKTRIIRTARSYRGTPYDAYYWNCSDFTSAVYGNAVGVWMPDWDDKQRFYGRQVRYLKRGDLLLFREYAGEGPVTHVGVYAGRGMIWHASSYFMSTVKSDMSYIGGYRGARRIR